MAAASVRAVENVVATAIAQCMCVLLRPTLSSAALDCAAVCCWSKPKKLR